MTVPTRGNDSAGSAMKHESVSGLRSSDVSADVPTSLGIRTHTASFQLHSLRSSFGTHRPSGPLQREGGALLSALLELLATVGLQRSRVLETQTLINCYYY